MKRAIILKINLPVKPGVRHAQGSRIKVSDYEYRQLVPKLAHDAETYLAAQAEAKEAREKKNPDKVKAFKAAGEARRDNAKRILAAREVAAEAKEEADAAAAAARLEIIERREAQAQQIEANRIEAARILAAEEAKNSPN